VYDSRTGEVIDKTEVQKASERICVRGPRRICPKGQVTLVLRALYGRRKAGQMWQELIYDTMVNAVLTVIEVVANTLYHAEDDIMVTCHGDHLLACGVPDRLDKFYVFLANHFQIKFLAKVGPGFEKVGHYPGML
jgi:hypothetical protein